MVSAWPIRCFPLDLNQRDRLPIGSEKISHKKFPKPADSFSPHSSEWPFKNQIRGGLSTIWTHSFGLTPLSPSLAQATPGTLCLFVPWTDEACSRYMSHICCSLCPQAPLLLLNRQILNGASSGRPSPALGWRWVLLFVPIPAPLVPSAGSSKVVIVCTVCLPRRMSAPWEWEPCFLSSPLCVQCLQWHLANYRNSNML